MQLFPSNWLEVGETNDIAWVFTNVRVLKFSSPCVREVVTKKVKCSRFG